MPSKSKAPAAATKKEDFSESEESDSEDEVLTKIFFFNFRRNIGIRYAKRLSLSSCLASPSHPVTPQVFVTS